MKKSALKKQISQARKNAMAEAQNYIASSNGGFYAKGLAFEGYTGGYLEALDDIELALDGVWNNNSRFWPQPE